MLPSSLLSFPFQVWQHQHPRKWDREGGGSWAEVLEQQACGQRSRVMGTGSQVAGEVGRSATSHKQVHRLSVSVNILRIIAAGFSLSEEGSQPEKEEGEEGPPGHQHELVGF